MEGHTGFPRRHQTANTYGSLATRVHGKGWRGRGEEEEEETDTDVGQVTLNPGLCSTASFSPRWEESQSRPALSTRPAEKA